MSAIAQASLFGGFEPAIGLIRREPLQLERKIAEARRNLGSIEDKIEDLRSEYSDLQFEIEKMEKLLRTEVREEQRFPTELFDDGLTGAERDFLEYVREHGCEDDGDEKRLRAIIQNHAGWWERIAA